MPGTGAKTSEAIDNASDVVGEISERGFWVLGSTGETSEMVACVVGAMSDMSEMDGCVAEISETISWIVEVTGVIADLVAEPKIGEISVMFGWLPRYVETLEKIE